MGELREIKCGKKAEVEGCAWCHKDYPCHKEGHDSMNCPRVEELVFLGASEVHYDRSDEPVWTIQAVRFKRPLEFEILPIGDSEDT